MASETAGGGSFTWDAYVDWLVDATGSLAAVADRLAAAHGYADDVGTVERALRRLRSRGQGQGGKWGDRALRRFGLPDDVDARLRWMGVYHSRFTDLPVPLCEDLIRAWDRPPTSDTVAGGAWLQLAKVTVALRRDQVDEAERLLRGVSAAPEVPVEARIERLLVQGFVASRRDRAAVTGWLAPVEGLLDEVVDPAERACLRARWTDQRAFELHRRRPRETAEAERLYRSLPEDGPPFALARRASGLAYARWKLGFPEEAVGEAERAARFAGDGGHVRLRAMALALVARIDPGRTDAAARARAIAADLDDDVLAFRFRRRSP